MHKSEVRMYRGVPTLFIDDKPITPMAFDFMSSDPDITNNIPVPPSMPSEIQVKAMYSAGVRLFFIRTELRDPRDTDDIVDKLLRTVRMVRKNAPDAYAIPWLIISAYEDFVNKYPDDVQTFDDGSTGDYTGSLSGRMKSSETPRHTHASLAWRHETAGVLRHIVRRVNQTPDLSDAVVGYFFFPLHHEANYFYDYDHKKKLDDYGPATRLAMRNYLAEKYRGDVSELRKAWGDDTITFENAPLPDRAARENGTAGVFWDPAKSRQVMDYAEIRSHVWADTLEYFARACKEESHYNAVVGTFYGYLLHNDTLWGGQSYFRALMDSPYIDFWASPFHYDNKNPGQSVTLRQLTRTLQKHGKLFFAEEDTTISSSLPHERERQGLVYPDTTRDSEILKRNFSMVLTEGLNGWWPDFTAGHGMYDPDDQLPTVAKIQRAAKGSINKPMGSVAEVACVVQQEGFFCSPKDYNLNKSAIEQSRLHELPYLGAPIDHFELQDVLDGTLPHKLYVFQNAYLLSQKEREAINALRSPSRMQVFMYAQGFLSTDNPTASAENISELTGIKLKQIEGECDGKIVLTKEAKLLGLKEGDEIGECVKLKSSGFGYRLHNFEPYPYNFQMKYDPVFVVDDPDAIVLGVYKDTGLPAFAIKDVDGSKSVYIGSTIVNTAALRGLCKLQGVHLYTEEDGIIYANESYIGIHAVRDGEVTISLPDKKKLFEVFDEEEYTVENGKLKLDLKLGDTRLFTYE